MAAAGLALGPWLGPGSSPSGPGLGGRGDYPDAPAFSPSGKILATADSDGTARLWDVATRRQIGAAMTPGGRAVVAVAFSPDGKILAPQTLISRRGYGMWPPSTRPASP